MTNSDASEAPTGLLADLTDEQRAHLEARGWVKVGKDIAWIEPGGGERREPLSRAYYVPTRKGIFRVSRLTREVVEV